ncbi:MAG: Mur ligase family protein, partial [Terrimicrobiaceae bacterium]|nr:Mur ligase family protein [Terrimicrobiaceae bacterium]
MAGCGWSRSGALDWLESSQRFGIKLGLENTRRLLDALGNPDRGLRFLHVAGTNGKGSVCAMLDSVLRQAGFKTGLYTSPHLVDFAERIRVNGVKIPDPELCDGLGRLRQAVRGWDHAPTYFELATVLAAWHFARSGCEWVVWETGMGGRLDATNVVDPAVAIITPIGLDHQQWLGETIGAIAGEKAGILKPGRPAVSSAQSAEAAEVLRRRAEALGVALEFVHSSWPGPLGLEGAHQRANAALAARALERAGIAIGGDALAQG